MLQPWQVLVTVLAGWMCRRQQEVIDYLRDREHGAPRTAGQETNSAE